MYNKELHKAFETLTKKVAEIHGMDVSKFNLRYNEVEMNYSITFKSQDAKDLKREFEENAYILGFRSSLYGESALDPRSGESLTMVGINTRAKKYPFIVENETGTKYKLSTDAARRMYNDIFGLDKLEIREIPLK